MHFLWHRLPVHVVVVLRHQLIRTLFDLHEFEVDAATFVRQASQVLTELSQLSEMQLSVSGIFDGYHRLFLFSFLDYLLFCVFDLFSPQVLDALLTLDDVLSVSDSHLHECLELYQVGFALPQFSLRHDHLAQSLNFEHRLLYKAKMASGFQHLAEALKLCYRPYDFSFDRFR